MKFLVWEIKYIGFTKLNTLSKYNKKLINNAIKIGTHSPDNINKIRSVKYVREQTGATLKEAHEFCKKYIYPKI